MEYFVILTVIFSMFMMSTTVIAHQSFHTTPNNLTAVVGETVVLRCGINNKTSEMQWTKDGFGLGLPEDVKERERYSMIISSDNVHHDLEIQNVKLEDEGIFQCQVPPGPDGSLGLRSTDALLTVNVPTSYPIIIQGSKTFVQENLESQLDCITKGAKPPAKVKWIDDSGTEIKDGVQVIEEMLEDEKRFNTRSVLRFLGSENLHNKTFTCEVYNDATNFTMTTHVRVSIVYMPIVSVEILPLVVREFGDIEATCKVKASASTITYSWQLNGKLLVGEVTNKVLILNVTRKHHQSILSCHAKNDVGDSKAQGMISLNYGPLFRVYPQNVYGQIGASFFLFCDSDGNPAPLIFWIQEASKSIVHHGKNYTDTLSHHNYGTYVCQAQVQGYAPILAKVNVYVQGPPKIISKAAQFGKKGDNVSIDCVAESIPVPSNISWTRFGRKKALVYNIKHVIVPHGIRSSLMVFDAKEDDFGEYECTMINKFGTDSIEIYMIETPIGKHFLIMLCVAVIITLVVSSCSIFLLLSLCSERKIEHQINNTNVDKAAQVSGPSSEVPAVDETERNETPQTLSTVNKLYATRNDTTKLPWNSIENDSTIYSECHTPGNIRFASSTNYSTLQQLQHDYTENRFGFSNFMTNNENPYDSIVFKTQRGLNNRFPTTENKTHTNRLSIRADAAQVRCSLPLNLPKQKLEKAFSYFEDENKLQLKPVSDQEQKHQKTSQAQSTEQVAVPQSNLTTCLNTQLVEETFDEIISTNDDGTRYAKSDTRKCKDFLIQNSNERSNLLQEIRNGISLKKVESTRSAGTLVNSCKENKNGTNVKPIQRSFTLGPTDGLGQAIAHAIELRNKSHNADSSGSSCSEDDFIEDDWK